MVNVNIRNKDIESLRKQLHNASSSVPKIDPFSKQGVQEWNEWAQGCREIESQLRDYGVQL